MMQIFLVSYGSCSFLKHSLKAMFGLYWIAFLAGAISFPVKYGHHLICDSPF